MTTRTPAAPWIPHRARRQWDRLTAALADVTTPCMAGDPDDWSAADADTRARAAAACRGCPAIEPCRSFAVAADEDDALVWGGR